jgi:hypothetical protein
VFTRAFGGGLAVVASVGTAGKTAAVSGVERLPEVCADETWVESGTVGAATATVVVSAGIPLRNCWKALCNCDAAALAVALAVA